MSKIDFIHFIQENKHLLKLKGFFESSDYKQNVELMADIISSFDGDYQVKAGITLIAADMVNLYRVYIYHNKKLDYIYDDCLSLFKNILAFKENFNTKATFRIYIDDEPFIKLLKKEINKVLKNEI